MDEAAGELLQSNDTGGGYEPKRWLFGGVEAVIRAREAVTQPARSEYPAASVLTMSHLCNGGGANRMIRAAAKASYDETAQRARPFIIPAVTDETPSEN